MAYTALSHKPLNSRIAWKANKKKNVLWWNNNTLIAVCIHVFLLCGWLVKLEIELALYHSCSVKMFSFHRDTVHNKWQFIYWLYEYWKPLYSLFFFNFKSK